MKILQRNREQPETARIARRLAAPLRQFLLLFFLLLPFGCNPATATVPPTAGFTKTAVDTFALPPAWTRTATRTATVVTATELTPSSTPTITRTLLPSRTLKETAKPSETPSPQQMPTSGLYPSRTLAPDESCPSPTYAPAEFQFTEDPRDYGLQILGYLRSRGRTKGLQEELEKLGKTDSKIVDPESGETESAFFADIIELYETDVTGDSIPEIIINLLQIKSGIGYLGDPEYEMVTFMMGCRNREYQWLNESNISYFYQLSVNADWSGIAAVRDLNANGLREIVLANAFIASPDHDMKITTEIVEWDGTLFQGVIAPGDQSKWGYSMNSGIEFQDVDENGTTDLLFAERQLIHDCRDGPGRTMMKYFMWTGEYYQFMWVDSRFPEYRFQAALNGDYYTSFSPSDPKTETAYRMAIDDPALKAFSYDEWGGDACVDREPVEPNEPQRIIAYARFRLLELLVYLKRTEAAAEEWKYISDNYWEGKPGYRYASLANTFWGAFLASEYIDDACAAVKAKAVEFETEVFGPLDYGENNPGPTLETICPFHWEKERR